MLGDTCGMSFWTSEEGGVREAGEVEACLMEGWKASRGWTSWRCQRMGCKLGEGSKAAYLESCARALSAWLGFGGAPAFLSVWAMCSPGIWSRSGCGAEGIKPIGLHAECLTFTW